MRTTLLGLAGAAGLLVAAPAIGDDTAVSAPSTMTLAGIVREFRPFNVSGGHPDFEIECANGPAIYSGIAGDTLDGDGKPVFNSTGGKVTTQPTDGQGKPIIGVKPYLQARSGDTVGLRNAEQGGAATSEQAFKQWFRDTPGVNLSRTRSVVLQRQAGSGFYIFDGNLSAGPRRPNQSESSGDSGSASGQGGANGRGDFTFEVEATFTAHPGSGQFLGFTGDDDFWLYIDGKLVVDLGGVHDRTWQTIDVDRIIGLSDGQECRLKLFYCERHKATSGFRLETNLELRGTPLPPVSAMCD